MASVPTSISLTYSAVGIREDLSNVIYNIAPLDTPFLSGCGKETADNTHFEWQTDTIAGGAANRQKEGEDPDNDARVNPAHTDKSICNSNFRYQRSSRLCRPKILASLPVGEKSEADEERHGIHVNFKCSVFCRFILCRKSNRWSILLGSD